MLFVFLFLVHFVCHVCTFSAPLFAGATFYILCLPKKGKLQSG